LKLNEVFNFAAGSIKPPLPRRQQFETNCQSHLKSDLKFTYEANRITTITSFLIQTMSNNIDSPNDEFIQGKTPGKRKKQNQNKFNANIQRQRKYQYRSQE